MMYSANRENSEDKKEETEMQIVSGIPLTDSGES